MIFQLKLTQRAERDVAATYRWIAERSVQGANRWYNRFLELLKSLTSSPEIFPFANEAEGMGLELREALFKTPRGKFYRALFIIEGEEVRIITVRGPGQAPVTVEDFEL